ncbi:phosphoribosylformylglycinamidine synthase subunit PurQ [Nisaea sediminum]|uniref:phosphoribosylformylglycinamidine synthase subunit PurQ n=1 Tax=Nisaea sediminum TaxID=2775867 RepID=UPI001868347E|nr:phosphoribosylformylglycinamidine synthase subunit PurQ [Nisaea sediminum]
MKSAIIVFPGTNRERDMAVALQQASGKAPHMVWHRDTDIPDVDLIVVPGGFSYGDYLRAGAIAAHSPVLRSLKEKADKGVPVMGVCNGFQVLTETGLLPGVLMRNAGLKFICRNVGMRVETSQSLFTGGYEDGQVLSIPVAHHDGNYFADERTLDEIEQNGQVAFRYVDENGEMNAAGNPNGSARSIAGVFNKEKTVLGFMPHPENAIDSAVGGTDGRGLFDGLVRALS